MVISFRSVLAARSVRLDSVARTLTVRNYPIDEVWAFQICFDLYKESFLHQN